MPLSTFAAHTFRPDTFSAQTLNGVQGDTGTFEVFLNDSISVVDALLLEVHYSRSVVASVLALDYVSNETTKGLTDSVALADTASPYLDASRALVDSLTTADALTVHSDYVRTGNDAVATADAGTTTLAFARASTDNAVVLDDLTVDLIRPAIGEGYAEDSVTVTDASTTEAVFGRSNSDALAALDATSPALDALRSTQDAVSILDALSIEVARTLADSVTTPDTVTVALDYSRSAQDVALALDVILPATDYRRSTDDSVTVDDTASPDEARVLDVSFADSITVADVLNREVWIEREVADPVLALDSTARIVDWSRIVDDLTEVTDYVPGAVHLALTILASVNATIVPIISATRPAPEIPINNAPTPLAPREQLGVYGYIVVQRLPVTFATPFHAYPQQLRLLEDQMRKFGVKAERSETYTGLTVYRVSGDALWRVPVDRQGRFLSWSSLKWRVFTTNPVPDTDLRSPWRPI